MMGLRLHIGCGGQIRPGFVNIDETSPQADIRMRIQDLDYPAGSVERIEGFMVLEHLTMQDARAFVRRAFAMLESGGVLLLECPDLEKVCRLILQFKDDPQQLEEGPFGLRAIFGEPATHLTVADFHKWGYTPVTARRLFRDAGFEKVTISEGASHGYPLRDMRIEGVK